MLKRYFFEAYHRFTHTETITTSREYGTLRVLSVKGVSAQEAMLDSRTRECYSIRQKEFLMDTKLTVRVPRHLLVNAKRYARAHQTTLTGLISAYLQHIPSESEVLDFAPIVRRLTGLLSPEVSTDDYKKHLEDKYGGR